MASKKVTADILVGAPVMGGEGEEDSGEMDLGEIEGEAYKAVAEDILSAVRAGDADSLADALKSLKEI